MSSSHLNRLAALVSGAALVAAGIAGCGDEAVEGQAARARALIPTPALVREVGELAICADMTYPPMTFMKANQPAGVDVDLAERIAELMGTTARFAQTGFPGIIAALEAGKCDVIMNGMNVSEERQREIDFVIYAKATQTFMVERGDPTTYSSVDDFAGKQVGVQVGSTNLEFLTQASAELEQRDKQPIDVNTFPKDPDAVAALRTGKLDAYFADSAVVAYYERQNPAEFLATDVVVNPIPYGIGLRQDEDELERALQRAVDELYAQGEAQRILRAWNLDERAYRPGA